MAKALLAQRLWEVDQGKTPGSVYKKTRIEDLAEELIADYRINGRKSAFRVEICIRKHLLPFFRGMAAPDITTGLIKRYVAKRIESGAKNATINRELSALKRMFRLAAQETPPRVEFVPFIPMLKENNVRKGFFEHESFVALREALPEHIRPAVDFGYNTGWRRSEILELTWDRVDMREGTVRLEPGETKNDDGRDLYMTPVLKDVFKELFRGRRLDCNLVFHRDGRPLGDFRDSWRRACEKAGVPGMLFHDFRRTAVRNMVRAGIPEKVAMTISGHKTRSVFDRYHIVSSRDLKEAARRQQAYLEEQERQLQSGYSGPESQKKGG
ncbi:MAG: tyrosine-type recombinase/integrase [Thermodesulfobacteriota bacterium]